MPIADALVRERGYTQSRRSGPDVRYFGPSSDGMSAGFVEPLDRGWIRENFALPPGIYFQVETDELVDSERYISIQGSRPIDPTGPVLDDPEPQRRALPSADQGRPWARLLPIADALVQERGFTQSRPSGPDVRYFGPYPNGYLAQFAEPLDIAWIRRTFDLPADLVYDPATDELSDEQTWTSIQGSRTATDVRVDPSA